MCVLFCICSCASVSRCVGSAPCVCVCWVPLSLCCSPRWCFAAVSLRLSFCASVFGCVRLLLLVRAPPRCASVFQTCYFAPSVFGFRDRCVVLTVSRRRVCLSSLRCVFLACAWAFCSWLTRRFGRGPRLWLWVYVGIGSVLDRAALCCVSRLNCCLAASPSCGARLLVCGRSCSLCASVLARPYVL